MKPTQSKPTTQEQKVIAAAGPANVRSVTNSASQNAKVAQAAGQTQPAAPKPR